MLADACLREYSTDLLRHICTSVDTRYILPFLNSCCDPFFQREGEVSARNRSQYQREDGGASGTEVKFLVMVMGLINDLSALRFPRRHYLSSSTLRQRFISTNDKAC